MLGGDWPPRAPWRARTRAHARHPSPDLPTASDAVNGAADAVESAIDSAAARAAAAAEDAAAVADAVEADLEKAAEGVAAVADDAADRATAAVEAVAVGVGGAADAASAAVADAAAAADAVAADLKAAAADASEVVDDVADAASAAVADAADAATAAVADAADAAADAAAAARAAVDGAATAATEAAATVKDALRAAPSVPPFQTMPLIAAPVSPPPNDDPAHALRYCKARLLAAVAGLDRGAAASAAAAAEVEATAAALIAAGPGAVDLTWRGENGAAPVDAIAGTWRLLYSSNFARGRGGGRRGPPLLTLGQIYQVVSPYGGRLDNVVELVGPAPPPLPLPALPGATAATPPPSAPVTLTATLRHALEIGAGGATVRITYEGSDVKADGGYAGLLGALPSFPLPELPSFLRPSRAQRGSSFDVLYLDGDLRVTRGERGELRVFCRAAKA